MGLARWLVGAPAILLAASSLAGHDVAAQGRPPIEGARGPVSSERQTFAGIGKVYDTDLASHPIVRTDVSTFDVGGLKLGMSANEVERIARSRDLTTGMQRRLQRFDDAPDGDRMPSFDTRAANIAADRLNAGRPAPVRVLNHAILKDAQGNRYDLRFMPAESGPVLDTLAYTTSMNGNSTAAYLTALKSRYGAPALSGSSAGGFTASWCARVDPTCQTSPHLNVVSDNAVVNMYLDSGYLRRKALDQRIEAKAASLAAASARKPVF